MTWTSHGYKLVNMYSRENIVHMLSQSDLENIKCYFDRFEGRVDLETFILIMIKIIYSQTENYPFLINGLIGLFQLISEDSQ